MSLARAVSDEVLSHEILKTVADRLKNPALADIRAAAGDFKCC
jgi:hypothetical protein